MNTESTVAAVIDTVSAAASSGSPLCIQGGQSKSFLSRQCEATALAVDAYRGIVEYEPSELVVTVRAGTPLPELEGILAEQGQMLAFEPPHFGASATIGGTVACGLSGPRRPYAGAVRDFVLGTRCINGKGEDLRFGGQVMKNVAGYDVSRLMCGAMGTLGVLLEISLKVLPAPESEITLCKQLGQEDAIRQMNELAGRPLPLTGAAWIDGLMIVRMSGTASGVDAARHTLKFDEYPNGESFWQDLREQRLDFFAGDRPLWRLSVPPTQSAINLDGDCLLDWGGGLRWVRTQQSAEVVRDQTQQAGGHATLFRGDQSIAVRHPLTPPLLALHQRLKAAFDPAGILNPGCLYREI